MSREGDTLCQAMLQPPLWGGVQHLMVPCHPQVLWFLPWQLWKVEGRSCHVVDPLGAPVGSAEVP